MLADSGAACWLLCHGVAVVHTGALTALIAVAVCGSVATVNPLAELGRTLGGLSARLLTAALLTGAEGGLEGCVDLEFGRFHVLIALLILIP